MAVDDGNPKRGPFVNTPKPERTKPENVSIAILGWGSLIWCSGSLRIRTQWRPDGPPLPIEFARISQDNRLTLVIHPGAEDQPTYWALSEFTTLTDARSNLRTREKSNSSDIHHVLRDGTFANGVSQEIAVKMTQWLTQHEDVEAVLWTGLLSNWREKRGRDFGSEDAVKFLLELEAERDRSKTTYDRAREYVTNTPRAVDTAVRKAMRIRGWADVLLSSSLIEPPPFPPKSK